MIARGAGGGGLGQVGEGEPGIRLSYRMNMSQEQRHSIGNIVIEMSNHSIVHQKLALCVSCTQVKKDHKK